MENEARNDESRPAGEVAMSDYRVRFLKEVYDGTGHRHVTCQSTVEVVAGDAEEAITVARRHLSSGKRSEWPLLVDRFEVDVTRLPLRSNLGSAGREPPGGSRSEAHRTKRPTAHG
jgi:hypothetical protein